MKTTKAEQSDGPLAPTELVMARLQELTRSKIAELSRFAQWRLDSYHVTDSSGEDIAQSCFMSILGGDRKPRMIDVMDADAFQQYLHWMIKSKVEAAGRRQSLNLIPLDDDIPQVDGSPASAAIMADLKLHLFAELKEQAPRRLQPTIGAWEGEFFQADRIPAINGYRKYACEVRELARGIVSSLDSQNPLFIRVNPSSMEQSTLIGGY